MLLVENTLYLDENYKSLSSLWPGIIIKTTKKQRKIADICFCNWAAVMNKKSDR